MARNGSIPAFPLAVSRRIMKRAAQGEEAVVVVLRDGRPTRVFGIAQYLKMMDLPPKVKPWQHRTVRGSPDPLGAIDAGVVAPLTRERLYEE